MTEMSAEDARDLVRRHLGVLNRIESHMGCALCHGPLTDGVCPVCQPEAAAALEPADWRYVLCPMPVLRAKYEDAAVEKVVYSATCGEELSVTYVGSETLLAHGPTGEEQTCWQVECRLGHVLVMPDYEGNDVDGGISAAWSLIRPLLDQLLVGHRSVL